MNGEQKLNLFAENLKNRNLLSNKKDKSESDIFEGQQDFDVDAVLEELDGSSPQN